MMVKWVLQKIEKYTVIHLDFNLMKNTMWAAPNHAVGCSVAHGLRMSDFELLFGIE